MRRRTLALGGLALLALLAGCGLGPSEIPEDRLSGNASYEWEADANVSFDIARSNYQTVVGVTNTSELRVFTRDALGTEAPVQLSALQFRFPNGTVVDASHANLSASLASSRTRITLPAEQGQVGYTASRSGKSFASPVFSEGSYEMTLPPGARVGLPLLSQASPGGYEATVTDGRQTLRWAELDGGGVRVRYYLQRDLLLFGGLFAIVASVGLGGALYYLRQIRRLEDQREEMGIDVDYEDDDFGDGPPPGMR
jgi:hypothetical protein